MSTLKMNKYPGCDEIPVKLIMYAPDCVYESIAEIINQIASNGDFPREMNHGILAPLQKPGNSRGPVLNLRSNIILPMLRKIFSVCLMDQLCSRLDYETPLTQAAYRKERSTTEHVFAAKMAIERTTNARNKTLHLAPLHFSFDSIKRKDLTENLQHTIAADELHIMKMMLEVSLVVRCGDSISEPFQTDTSAPQGGCASANSFIYYLPKSLEVQVPDATIHDHHYHQSVTNHEIPDELTEHNYLQPTQIQHFNTQMEYADDLSKPTSYHNDIRRYEHNVEENLGKKGQKGSKNKTEN